MNYKLAVCGGTECGSGGLTWKSGYYYDLVVNIIMICFLFSNTGINKLSTNQQKLRLTVIAMVGSHVYKHSLVFEISLVNTPCTIVFLYISFYAYPLALYVLEFSQCRLPFTLTKTGLTSQKT